MAIRPNCDKCRKELSKPGALLFAETDKNGRPKKFHLCVTCYGAVALWTRPKFNRNGKKYDCPAGILFGPPDKSKRVDVFVLYPIGCEKILRAMRGGKSR